LKKAGAEPEHHAVIYTGKEPNSESENLTKRAIKVEVYNQKEKLDPKSRINYAKVYTIEYNVKVYFVGKVHPEYLHRVIGDYQNTVHPQPSQNPAYAPSYGSSEAPQNTGYTPTYEPIEPPPDSGYDNEYGTSEEDPAYGTGYEYEGAAGPSR
jgi:hypothetical protein